MPDITPLQQQGGSSLPVPVHADVASSPLLPPRRMADQLAHFYDGLYATKPESHLYRLMGVLLGEAGAGQLQKRLLFARLQSLAQGTHFYDLDRFYGGIFGISRRASEFLDINPLMDMAKASEWDDLRLKDADYRNRIMLLARGIHHGATAIGMEIVAEALTGVDCQIYELWEEGPRRTYADLEANTYDELEADIYGDLEQVEGIDSLRSVFIVRPRRPITLSERHDIKGVIDKLKPASSRAIIDADGQAVHRNVDVVDVQADSEHWEVIAKVQPTGDVSQTPYVNEGGGPTEQPRLPFGGYQGEAWNYNADIASVTANLLSADDLLVTEDVYQRIRYLSGVEIDYSAPKAVLSAEAVRQGRAASDGIMQIHPFAREISTYLEGIETEEGGGQTSGFGAALHIDRLASRLVADWRRRALEDKSLTTGEVDDTERFWSTPERPQNDPHAELIEIRLTEQRRVNYLSFELPRFPHLTQVEIYDEKAGQWIEVFQRKIRSCVPSFVSPSPNLFYNRHPQHSSTADHWEKVSFRFDEAKDFKRIRFKQTRHSDSLGPRWWELHRQWHQRWRWTDTPYSLGLRGVEVGYRVTGKEDLREEIDAGTDAYGARVEYSLKEHPARSILDGSGFWKSEPQPLNRAVVNLYVDARTSGGEAQTIDAIYLDPLVPGPHFTLYYSNDDPTAPWPAGDRDIGLAHIDVGGTVTAKTTGLYWNPGEVGYLDIDPSFVQFNHTADWSFHVALDPRWFSTRTESVTVFDLHGYRLMLGLGQIRLIDPNGAILSSPITFAANTPLRIVGGREGGSIKLSFKVGSDPQVEVEGDASAPTNPRNANLRLGTGFNTEVALDALVTRFMVRQGPPNPAPFLVTPQGAVETSPGNSSAVLRFSASYITEDNPYGFRGGLSNHYETLSWTPISLDFVLQRGTLSIPPRRAKYWKFEFTNLVAEPYETFIKMSRKVKIFPPNAKAPSQPDPLGHGAEPSGMVASRDLVESDDFIFRDSTIQGVEEAGEVSKSFAPTDAFVANDPLVYERVKNRPWLHLTDWHIGQSAPMFDQEGMHNYHEVEVRHDTKVGYFVGLKGLNFYRVSYEATDDPAVYREHFADAQNISSIEWNLGENRIWNEDVTDVEVTSKSFNSKNRITAIQFATQQSPAVQIMGDDDFRDSDFLSSTDWLDTDEWHRYGDAVLSYEEEEHSVIVYRNVVTGAEVVGDAEPMVAPPVHPIAGGGGGTPGVGGDGGIESPQVVPSDEGSIWAAVRFTVLEPLAEPYKIQILRGDTDAVLVEREVDGLVGETREEYIGHEIGSVAPAGTPVYLRFVQGGVGSSRIKLDTLSLFDMGIIWEFSVDGGANFHAAFGIRNNPHGVLTFPTPGNQLVWRARATREDMNISSLQIRPWYEGAMPSRASTEYRGPTVSLFDHEPPIKDDPEFNLWPKPVPYSWFMVSRRFPILAVDGNAVKTKYSKYFARPAFDDISGMSDAMTAVRTLVRGIDDTIAGMGDDIDRSGSTFYRGVYDDIDEMTDTASLEPTEEGGIIGPISNPIPPDES